jgi:hypothetical protein
VMKQWSEHMMNDPVIGYLMNLFKQKQNVTETPAYQEAVRRMHNEPQGNGYMLSDSAHYPLEDMFRINPRYQMLMDQWDSMDKQEGVAPQNFGKRDLWNQINGNPKPKYQGYL